MARKSKPWIVVGGRRGELAHCRHCGIGLDLGRPQSIQVTVGAMEGFTKDHEHCKPGDNPHPEVITRDNWPTSRDTGISSWTIYSVMRGLDAPDCSYRPPQDPDDFGRCYRLLNLFPEWKSRLPEVAVRFPEWSGLIREWEQLEALFVVSQDRDRSKLYLLIQDLLKEGGAT